MNTLDDKIIVSRVLAGDVQLFSVIVKRYHGPLSHVAMNSLGRLDLAEEAVQETFVSAFRSLSTYKTQFSFRTWLWTILLNQCRRQRQRFSKLPRQTCESHADEGLFSFVESDSPEQAAMHQERNLLLTELMQTLPAPQADAVRLRFFGHLKFREIAEAMDSSLSCAKQRVRLGLEAISQQLRERNLVDSVFPGDTT